LKLLRKNIYNSFLKSLKIKSCLNKLFDGNLDTISGLGISAKAMLVAYIAEKFDIPVMVVSSGSTKALSFQNKLNILSDKNSVYFIQQESSPYQAVFSDAQVLKEEIDVLRKFKAGQIDIMVMSAQSLLTTYPSNKFYNNYSIKIEIKKEYEPAKLAEKLVKIGYRRASLVTDVGEFSLRGDILDIYSVNENPVRIGFWGDETESIRYFDIATQRTVSTTESITIEPRYKIVVSDKPAFKALLNNAYNEHKKHIGTEYLETLEAWFQNTITSLETELYFEGIEYFSSFLDKDYNSVFDFLPDNVLVIFDESQEVILKAELQNKKYIDENKKMCEEGLSLPLPTLNHLDFEILKAHFNNLKKLKLDSFIEHDDLHAFINCSLMPRFIPGSDDFCDYINDLKKEGCDLIFATQYPARVQEILLNCDIPCSLEGQGYAGDAIVFKSDLTEGFVSSDLKLAVITDVEMFNRKIKKPTLAKRISHKENIDYIDSINDLQINDYVVHLTHGVGKYLGLSQQEIDRQFKDYLTIEYYNADKLHIPAEQSNMLSRYRGSPNNPPKLSKMGGADWNGTKSKVKKAVDDIAHDLLRIYAKRAGNDGFAFDADSPWQLEMEDVFQYTDTPHQMQAIIDTKQNMESSNPMDRLICGDVGFGKTEVAIRAIFKAVLSGKQVAMLVPTTILAQQHYQTIKERFAPYPVGVELMSRFKTASEQKKILTQMATGGCDVVIGTHRLIQNDVVFKDLGLLVIDEEHRFGVAHKEKLKKMRAEIDVLSLSATPIPRTLYMSLSGVRDMSLINTPPVNRAPIKTFVGEYNDALVKTAINYEIEREGQIFFLYNRVQTIYKFADETQKLLPNARIAVAHGQMKPKELEQIMYEFSVQNYDVLICTTIIESGLDIPNANTIIIYDADKFGLAQLYQIRGRVGRSERQAYAYCFFRKDKVLTDDAKDRLNAIKDFTTLGSGYQIAMRDLEIRGVGNILGASQHGHMTSVGFDVYCSLLDDAIKEIQGEKVSRKTPPIIDINITAFIPDDWVGDSQQKMIEYKRLADVSSIRELELLQDEWKDRFGKIPDTVHPLIKIIRLRLIASQIEIVMVRETLDCIRIYTGYKQFEWNLIKKNMPPRILQKLKWVKAPQNFDTAESIILLNNYALTGNEIMDLLEDLFYYILELQKNINININ
jgi:transcription-repair coupling factor (superfamily II helicase)